MNDQRRESPAPIQPSPIQGEGFTLSRNHLRTSFATRFPR
jgi:hypothetical protein